MDVGGRDKRKEGEEKGGKERGWVKKKNEERRGGRGKGERWGRGKVVLLCMWLRMMQL